MSFDLVYVEYYKDETCLHDIIECSKLLLLLHEDNLWFH